MDLFYYINQNWRPRAYLYVSVKGCSSHRQQRASHRICSFLTLKKQGE